jgi:arylsulfatase A-like enzyme
MTLEQRQYETAQPSRVQEGECSSLRESHVGSRRGVRQVRILIAAVLLVFGAWAGRADAAQPSFVVVVADDLGTAQMSALAKVRSLLTERGTNFTNAFIESPICAPSRATLLTGRFAHNHDAVSVQTGGERIKPLESDTLATRLRAAGYRTSFYGKYINGYRGDYTPAGWAHWRGYVDTLTYGASVRIKGAIRPVPGNSDRWMRDDASQVVYKTPASTPLLLVLASTNPHLPHLAPPEYVGMHAGRQVPRGPAFNEADVSDKPAIFRDALLTPAQVQTIDRSWAASLDQIQTIDEMVAGVHAALRDTGRLANTYFIFTSDNGIHFGQHRQREDKTQPWDTDLRVPLVIRGPGVAAGVNETALVGNVDVAPTILELAGLPPSGMDGTSFAGAVHGGEGLRRAIPIAFWDQRSPYRLKWKGVRTARHTWVEYREGARMLYDNDVDPRQLDNLAGRSDSAELRESLMSLTERLLACEGSLACRIGPS